MAVKTSNSFFEFYIYNISSTLPALPTNPVPYDPLDPEIPWPLDNNWLELQPTVNEGEKLWVAVAQFPITTSIVTINQTDWISISEYTFFEFPGTVDEAVPRAGIDNPSQGLRLNFSTIKESLDATADELEYLRLRLNYAGDRVGQIATDYIEQSEKGAANGVASLDGTGNIPETQLGNLPAEIEFYANLAAFPVSGNLLSIYVTEDTNLVYRWNGSAYIKIASSGTIEQPRTIAATGGVTWSVSFDGSQNVTSAAVVNNITTLGTSPYNSPMQIWRGTQAQYDTIVTPDDNTLYIII